MYKKVIMTRTENPTNGSDFILFFCELLFYSIKFPSILLITKQVIYSRILYATSLLSCIRGIMTILSPAINSKSAVP